VVCKGSGFAPNKWTDLSNKAAGDIILVDIKRRGEKMTMIVIIYDQREGETEERPSWRLNWQRIIRQGGGGTVLAGDFNAHCQR
jgi:hypothetical protein